MRIYILGNSGAGKTTLATHLSHEQKLPVLHLDDVFWDNTLAYGTKRAADERAQILHNFIQQKDWIVEGIYTDWVEEALVMSDRIIYLKIHPIHAQYRLIRRYFRRKKGIESGRNESFRQLLELLVWHIKNEKEIRLKQKTLIETYKEKVLVIKDLPRKS